MEVPSKIAEVVESSSAEFTAQCYKLEQAPPLGCLVRVGGKPLEIYGVVYNIETHSLEPGRRIVARGEKMESEDEIFQANPQLSRLLRTDFNVLVVGYSQGDSLCQHLPQRPAPIHGFVYICTEEEIRTFTDCLDFLGLLVDARLPVPMEEVTAACLRYISQAHPDRQAFLVRAGRELAYLLSGDARKLSSLLKRLK
ncbi:MAG TPA: hypothetical protein EYP71_06880 [Dehalococcoidia bacterium]|nr:hypothetical protein [Dehalococcoidia bacterium]